MQYLANVQGVPIQNELATRIDCIGKFFYCVDSLHFLQCFDVDGSGKTQTMNNKAQPCTGTLFCDNANQFECSSVSDPAIAQSPASSDPAQPPAPVVLTETFVSSGKWKIIVLGNNGWWRHTAFFILSSLISYLGRANSIIETIIWLLWSIKFESKRQRWQFEVVAKHSNILFLIFLILFRTRNLMLISGI